MRIAALILIVTMFVVPSAGQILLNEIDTGTTDWVEIANMSGVPADVSGWLVDIVADIQAPLGGVSVFPGTMNSGTIVIQPNRSMILTDDATFATPVVPVGTIVLAGNDIPWSANEAGSIAIFDTFGNGIDYVAFGNPNILGAALFLGGGLTTTWTGSGSPLWGATDAGANTLDLHFRHQRTDSDDATDFTMRSNANSTAGLLNVFQRNSNSDGVGPTSAYSVNTTTGTAPLTVRFTNESQGDCRLSNVVWDFDFSANPGTVVANDRNASFTFTNPAGTVPGTSINYDVRLRVIDICGGTSNSPLTTITVLEPVVVLPQSIGFVETSEGPIDATTGTALSPVNGWDLRLPQFDSRIRTADPRGVGAPPTYVDAIGAAPTAVILDSMAPLAPSTQELVLHLDGGAITTANGTGDFRITIWVNVAALETTDLEDVIFLQDGVTAGNGVDNNGNVTANAGLDGFLEVFLSNYTATANKGQWERLEFVLDATFFAANGLVAPGAGLSNDYRLVVRHSDSGDYASGTGVLIDDVEVLNSIQPSLGSPGFPTLGLMDISHAKNANGHFVNHPGDENGPHFINLAPQGTMSITIEGEVNQPILLLAGPLNVLVADYTSLDPLLGTFDIGGPLDVNGIPTLLSVLADGSAQQLPPTLFNLIWNTGLDGSFDLDVALSPGLPPGFTISMQAVVMRAGGASISNCVVLGVL